MHATVFTSFTKQNFENSCCFFVAKTFKELKQGLLEMQRERKTHQDNTWGKTTKIDSYAYCRMPILFSLGF